MDAADAGNGPVVDLLLRHKANVNAMSDDGVTALMRAIFCDRSAVVTTLLEHGADVDAWMPDSHTTALIWAAALDDDDTVVRELLKHDADPNIADNQKYTPLMAAASAGNLLSVRAMLEAGADIDAVNNDGDTALEIARRSGFSEIEEVIGQVKKERAEEAAREEAREKSAARMRLRDTVTEQQAQMRRRAAKVVIKPS